VRAAVMAGGWIVGWLLLWRPPTLRRRRPTAASPASESPVPAPAAPESVAVVIPARDEADRLPLLLASLADQDHPIDELVVVDDHSRDDTAAIAASFDGVRVVAAPPLPEGWTGKSWACQVGVEATTSDVVALVDADVVLAPDALAGALDERRRTDGLVSVQPRHDVGGPIEALSLVFNVVAVMGLGLGSPLWRRPGWGAAGPLVVARREHYDRAGGHAATPGDVAEDLALAASFRRVGLPVRCVLGGEVVRFRMYRDLRGLLEGWSKNMATGARRTPALLGLGTALWITGLLAAASAVVDRLDGSAASVATAGGIYALVTAQVAILGRSVGRFGPAAAAWPLLVAVFVAVVGWSAVATFLVRRVTWSDRSIDLSRRGRVAS
jgi:4,4'-diaponeurosporenoate glycosyltransferase